MKKELAIKMIQDFPREEVVEWANPARAFPRQTEEFRGYVATSGTKTVSKFQRKGESK